MNSEAWSFLISRNKNIGYRTIVAPKFLIENKLSMLLAEVAGGELTEQGYVSYREIHNSLVGDLTLVFRVLHAQKAFIKDKEEGVLRDYYGRAIDWIEGVILKDRRPELVITNHILQRAHIEVEKHYCEFWKDIANTFTTKSVPSFQLELNSNRDEKLLLKKEYPFVIPDLPQKTKLSWKVERDSKRNRSNVRIKSLKLSPTGKYIVILKRDGNVEIYRLNKDFSLGDLKRKLFNAESFASDSNEKMIVFGLNKHGISQSKSHLVLRNWADIENDKEDYSNFNYGNKKEKKQFTKVVAIDFNQGENSLITITENSELLLWDIKTKSLKQHLDLKKTLRRPQRIQLQSVAFDYDGKILVAISYDDKSISLIHFLPSPENIANKYNADIISRQCLHEKMKSDVHLLAFSPDKKMLAGVSTETICIWNVGTGKQIHLLKKLNACLL